jgi:MinD superfamily P-loop ATPase
MKQLLILSGKGGTGKTTIAASFITLSKAKAFADCDVEAPNLHLLHSTSKKTSKPYFGMKKAVINQDLCLKCGQCQKYCRFDAVNFHDGYYISSFACEGCAVCELVCPANAIEMKDVIGGHVSLYQNGIKFSTAELAMGSGNSGKLVSEVKKTLKNVIKDEMLVIIDGSPGIGCPVTASLSGVDMVLIVAEPSVSGISDMTRIITAASAFRVKIAICVNKADFNLSMAKKIEDYARDNEVPFFGMIPYNQQVITYLNQGKQILDIDSEVSSKIRDIHKKTMEMLFQ